MGVIRVNFLTAYAFAMAIVGSAMGCLPAKTFDPETAPGEYPPFAQETGDSKPYVAYVAESVGNRILAYRVNPVSSTVEALPETATSPGPYDLRVDPQGAFLYSFNSEHESIDVFSIDRATGALKSTSHWTMAAHFKPRTGVFIPNGRRLYVVACQGTTDSGAGCAVITLRIEPNTGAIIDVQGSPATAPDNAELASIGHRGRALIVVGSTANSTILQGYRIDNGRMLPVAAAQSRVVAAVTRPSAVLAADETEFAFLARREGDRPLRFKFNLENGVLEATNGNVYHDPERDGAQDCLSDSFFAAVMSARNGRSAGFCVSRAGMLLSLLPPTFNVSAGAWHAQLGPSGRVLHSSYLSAHRVEFHQTDANGASALIGGFDLGERAFPRAFAFWPLPVH